MKYLFFRSFLAVLILLNGFPLSAQYSWNSENSKMSCIFSAGAVFGLVCGWFIYDWGHKKLEGDLRTARNISVQRNLELQDKEERLTQAAGLLIENEGKISKLKQDLREKNDELQQTKHALNDSKKHYDKLHKTYTNFLKKKNELKQRARTDRKVREAKHAHNIGGEGKKREKLAQKTELKENI